MTMPLAAPPQNPQHTLRPRGHATAPSGCWEQTLMRAGRCLRPNCQRREKQHASQHHSLQMEWLIHLQSSFA